MEEKKKVMIDAGHGGKIREQYLRIGWKRTIPCVWRWQ